MMRSQRTLNLRLALLAMAWLCGPLHAEDEISGAETNASHDTGAQQNPSYRAKLMSQLVPDRISAGENVVAIVQYQNKSGTPWTSNGDYYLAPISGEPWLTRIDLPQGKTITAGETVTFRITMTAPLHPGEYPLQWQMHQGKTSFGEPTSSVRLKVVQPLQPWDDAEFVYQDVPQKMNANRDYNVVLQFKNTGKTSWTKSQYALATTEASDDLTWTISRIELPGNTLLRPGGFQTFRFTVRAPATPGQYPFQWQLLHLPTNRFGAGSDKLNIDVIP
ncbi:MAG: hypothetical protein HY272_09590 [Gammaproteobacteria bacterium]|nr:hypothetical protein [Gammaproteobacteria bacterium]